LQGKRGRKKRLISLFGGKGREGSPATPFLTRQNKKASSRFVSQMEKGSRKTGEKDRKDTVLKQDRGDRKKANAKIFRPVRIC